MQLAEVYDFPPGDGTGEVIGILEFGGGFFPDDLQLFCDTVGVSVPTVTPVSVDNTPTDTMDEAAGEVMLDVEVVAGACPGATQVVYFGSPQFDEKAWVDTLERPSTTRTTRRSSSRSATGSRRTATQAWQEGTIPHVNDTLQEAAMMGITICISSGDDGSADETDDGTSPNEIDGLAQRRFPVLQPVRPLGRRHGPAALPGGQDRERLEGRQRPPGSSSRPAPAPAGAPGAASARSSRAPASRATSRSAR